MTEEFTPDVILAQAGLSILPGGGYATLRLEISRNLFGGEALLRVEKVDPASPRRKPVNLIREAGLADVIIADKPGAEGVAQLLEMIAEALRRAARPPCDYPSPCWTTGDTSDSGRDEYLACVLPAGHLERHTDGAGREWQTGVDGPVAWVGP